MLGNEGMMVMGKRKSAAGTALRVKSHRRRQAAAGMKRVEVVVPSDDAEVIRILGTMLRTGGQEADRIRERLRRLTPGPRLGTGADIVAMFQNSPFASLQVEIPHDRTVTKPIEF
jgi:hypothetical protein